MPTHVHIQTQVFSRLPQSSFWINMALVCCLRWSVIYCCPHRTSQFLELVSTTQSTASLTFNTQQITTFLAIKPVRCHVCHIENLLHQSTLHCFSQRFHAIIAMGVLASIMSFNLCGQNYVCTHVQLSCVYFASTFTSHT